MNALDAELIRTIRREFGKRPMDITRLDIVAVNGRVSLTGQIANLRDQPSIDLKDEFAMVEKLLLKNQMVHSLTASVRLIQAEEKDEHEGGPRGRMRNL